MYQKKNNVLWDLETQILFIEGMKERLDEKTYQIERSNLLKDEKLLIEKERQTIAKVIAIASQKLNLLLEDISIENYKSIIPKFKKMQAPEYDAIKTRYYNILQKIVELEDVIHRTYCPVKLAFFNGDMRLLTQEKEEIFTYLIEQSK
ncbi:hypothetical protein I5M32_11350 [Pedobacter sp. SD-b]|uniref:Uncharacterized protein n=1 Tax=Pedobacter segetis TaxID=2793069 RepID=A0ABS1BKY2_9SPHI|nr:hypothetical protein [Pedobacter segetis]MBK0383553.1 hypothetical protein [Pedobacter segetis]